MVGYMRGGILPGGQDLSGLIPPQSGRMEGTTATSTTARDKVVKHLELNVIGPLPDALVHV